MAITRVWIEEGCISCGLSESNCPEIFKVKETKNSQLQDEKPGEWVKGATVIEGVDYVGLEEKIKSAAQACPVQVIKYEEEE